ncbi:MAG: rhamnulokinase [Verrucomicrobiae bacterium]|nr:rhamnulokinase [Verrucomicrobiae bacterium]
MSAKFLAFDLGAESGRAVLGELANEKIQLTELCRFLNKPREVDGHWHWTTAEFFKAMTDGLAKAGKAHPGLLSLGCDTWGVDYVTLGDDDRMIEEPWCYRDSRTDGMMEKAFGKVSKAEIYEETGIQFMSLNTLYQLFAASSGFGPDWAKVKTVLLMADYFHYLFSGRKVAEVSLASTTQAYNPRTRKWAEKLLKAAGVPGRVMPEIVPAGARLGSIQPAMAKQYGVSEKIQVVTPCSHDTGSAVAAVPASGSGRWAYLSCGTWSLLGVELPEPMINERSLAAGFTNEAGFGNTIRFLKNIVGLWILQECRRHWEKQGEVLDYAQLTRMAGEARPFAALINPADERFNKAGEMPGRIDAFCRESGQTPPQTKGEYARCILESLALEYRRVVEVLEGLVGYSIETLHLVGGGSKNRLLCQFTADALGCPVVSGPDEATALGNCLIQAQCLGQVRDLAHIRQIVRNSVPLGQFVPEQVDAWKKQYGKFRGLAG